MPRKSLPILSILLLIACMGYLADKKLAIIQGDTMRIMLLTRDILELYPVSEQKPAMFLKRSKDGKTSMSAQ